MCTLRTWDETLKRRLCARVLSAGLSRAYYSRVPYVGQVCASWNHRENNGNLHYSEMLTLLLGSMYAKRHYSTRCIGRPILHVNVVEVDICDKYRLLSVGIDE